LTVEYQSKKLTVEEREERMHPAEEHSWKPQHTTQDMLVSMVDEWGKALDE